eukprot:scaffold25564_cov75-Cyclotella_meneghiniana.AAC.5
MEQQLQYCTSVQFFKRCNSGGGAQFRSRVKDKLRKLYDDIMLLNVASSDLWGSILKVIDWKGLFINHNAEGSSKTALTEVLLALTDVLTKSRKKDCDCAAVAMLRMWSYYRANSNNNDVMWSTADENMLNFISSNFVEGFSSSSHPAVVLSWSDLFISCAEHLSRDIESAFTIESSEDKDGKSATSVKNECTTRVKSWVHLLKVVNRKIGGTQDSISNAMLIILSALDDVDRRNIDALKARNNTKKINIMQSGRICKSTKRERFQSSDMLEVMHDSSLDLGGNTPKRAKQKSQKSLQLSLKQVLSAPETQGSHQLACEAAVESSEMLFHQQSWRISTLTLEASCLRRELYISLVHFAAKSVCENTSTIKSKLREFIPILFSRIKSYPSPSVRLYTVLTLDHFRKIHDDKGYQYFMDNLLKHVYLQNGDERESCLKMYAEIVSYVNIYGSPRPLVSALSKLMEIALLPSLRSDNRMILRSIGNIMLRRQNEVSKLNDYDHQFHAKEFKRYHELKAMMSVEFDDPSYWITKANTNMEHENGIITVLQVSGILSLFHNSKVYSDYKDATCHVNFPYPDSLSLRSALIRLQHGQESKNVFTNPLSDSEHLYSGSGSLRSRNIQDFSPLSNIDHDGVLHEIFDFLGYRSLARASQCCKTWRLTANMNNRWCRLYFHKFKGAKLEEEISLPPNDSHEILHRVMKDYNWFTMFKNKYLNEKVARAHSIGKSSKYRSCQIVGCNVIMCYQKSRHYNTHIKQSRALAKKRLRIKLLKEKSIQLHQMMLQKWGMPDYLVQTLPDYSVKPQMHTPESLLQHVFSFLDVHELIHPVCKLWTELTQSNSLWYQLYSYHFGVPSVKWLSTPEPNNWKMHFRTFYQTNRTLNDDSNRFGWKFRICPVVGCCTVLGFQIDFDLHVVKHEVNFLERLLSSSKGKTNRKRKSGVISVAN